MSTKLKVKINSIIQEIRRIHKENNLRHLWEAYKHQIILFIATIISCILSYYKYQLDGFFTDEMDSYAERLGTYLFKSEFREWFQTYKSKHKYRLVYPLLTGIISQITLIEEKMIAGAISIVFTILSMHIISKMCKQRNFSDSDRYTVLLVFISNATVIANMTRVATDIIGLFFVINCMYWYQSYVNTGQKKDLTLSYAALILAMLTREILGIFVLALWVTPNERLDWKKRTLLFFVPLANAFAILLRFISWEWFLYLLSPAAYRHHTWWPVQYRLAYLMKITFEAYQENPVYLVKWGESLFYALLIPLSMAIFALPSFREIWRTKFKDRLDLTWFLIYILPLFVFRSSIIFGRFILPISWPFYLLVPAGTSQFVRRAGFKNQMRAKRIIIWGIILSGYLLMGFRILAAQFDLLDWIREA